jgi:MFS transporter, DHA1 family, multidrug resistance protein
MKFVLRRPVPPLWLLGLLTFSGPVGMHIFVPALPAAAKDLHATPVALEMTISLYILGLAVGQLLYGPVSDRFGRRPALLVGLSIFTVASIAGLFAPDIHTLVVARFFQALGGCSGLVLARAMIRDTSQAHEAARRLALTNLLVTAGPAVAPLIGGGLSALWGWRTILVGLSALGVANFMMTWLLLPETRPEALFVSASRYARDYVGLLRSRQFLGYAVGGACATTSLYAFIACAPFIFVDRLHAPSASVGLYLALLVSGIWLGSLLASQLIARFSLNRFVVVANAVSVVAAASFLGLLIIDRATLAGIIATMFVFSVGVGAAAPAALVKAISVNPRVTGTASGLYGSVQMAVAGTLVMLAGWGSNPAFASASVLLAAGVVAQASFWIARNRSVAVSVPESEAGSKAAT